MTRDELNFQLVVVETAEKRIDQVRAVGEILGHDAEQRKELEDALERVKELEDRARPMRTALDSIGECLRPVVAEAQPISADRCSILLGLIDSEVAMQSGITAINALKEPTDD